MARNGTAKSNRSKSNTGNSKPAAGRAGGTASALRRNALPIAGAAVAGLAAAAAVFFTRRPNALAGGHPAPDLEGDTHPGPDDRADPHFRPDMDAPMSKADREALAPALGKPTLVQP